MYTNRIPKQPIVEIKVVVGSWCSLITFLLLITTLLAIFHLRIIYRVVCRIIQFVL